MMGVKTPKTRLFYFFSLDDKVPQDHPLRVIAENVDFSFVYQLARPYYSHTGQPSIDPVVLLKMSLIGYLFGITSERKLAREIPLHMAYLWFLGYDIDEKTPDHSVLSKARARFDISLYQAFFHHVVRLCEERGLMAGNKLFVDATYVRANASLDSLVERGLYHKLPGSTDDYLKQVWEENPVEIQSDDNEVPPDSQAADSHQPRLPQTPKAGRQKANERYVSKTDADAAIVRDERKGLFLAYKAHLAVDGGQARVITAVSVTSGDGAEGQELPGLVQQHQRNSGNSPPEAVADGAYGTLANYEYLQGAGIKPAIPRHDSWKKKVFSRRQFTYEPQTDTYLCPEGQRLHRYEVRPEAGIVRYRASRTACRLCLRKTECTRGARRTVSRHFKEPVLDWALSYLQTEQAQQSIKQRKVWVETAIAEVKNWHGFKRASFRGRRRVFIQALLTAATYNLKKLARNALRTPAEEARARLEYFEIAIARTLSLVSSLRSLVLLARSPA